MKKTKTILVSAVAIALLALVTITGCSKKNNSDLTKDIVGTYWNNQTGSSRIDMTIIKVDDKTISIDISGYGQGAQLYSAVQMNSANSFTLNKVTRSELVYLVGDCNLETTGSGVFSNGNITISTNTKQTLVASPYTVTNNSDIYTAAKQ